MAGFSIQEVTELLSGPIGSRMFRHIAVKNPPEPISIATMTYRTSNVAVTEVNKSQATTARA